MIKSFQNHFSRIRWAIALFTLAVTCVGIEPVHAAEEKAENRNKPLKADSDDGDGGSIVIESVILRHESGRNVFVFKATNRSDRKVRFKVGGQSATLDPRAEYEAKLVSDSAGSERPAELTFGPVGGPETTVPLTFWSPE
jgi:hypothetical protein